MVLAWLRRLMLIELETPSGFWFIFSFLCHYKVTEDGKFTWSHRVGANCYQRSIIGNVGGWDQALDFSDLWEAFVCKGLFETLGMPRAIWNSSDCHCSSTNLNRFATLDSFQNGSHTCRHLKTFLWEANCKEK